MQKLPLPVWLKFSTREMLKLVTLLPIPRLIYVRAHGWDGFMAIDPPLSGHAVRLLPEISWDMLAPDGVSLTIC